MSPETVALQPKAKMTIRVYTVTRTGTITQDRGTLISLPHGYEPASEPCSPTCVHEGGTR